MVFEHGAGDVEEPVTYGAESAGMAATASFQNKIFGFALLVASPGGVRQVVNGVPQPWIAGDGIVTFGLPAFGSADASSPPRCFAIGRYDVDARAQDRVPRRGKIANRP